MWCKLSLLVHVHAHISIKDGVYEKSEILHPFQIINCGRVALLQGLTLAIINSKKKVEYSVHSKLYDILAFLNILLLFIMCLDIVHI